MQVVCSSIFSQIFTDISTGILIVTINHPYQLGISMHALMALKSRAP